jgi:hypothetical protein
MTSPGRRRKRSVLAGTLAITVAAVLSALLLCELVLRLLGVSFPVLRWTDPIRGVAHIPNSKSISGPRDKPFLVTINSDGWRGPDVALQHPNGTFRIALLGDSFIEAFEVPFESTIGEVLERRLARLRGTRVEVLNFGHGGYGTTQELLTLQHEVWKYSPDLILLAVTTGNDISDNFRPLKHADYVPYYVYRGTELVLDTSFLRSRGYRSRTLWTRKLSGVIQHSRVAQVLNRARIVQRTGAIQRAEAAAVWGDEVGLRDEVEVPPTTDTWREAWKVTEGILELMSKQCNQHHVPFAMVTLTRGIQVTPIREKKLKFMRELGVKDLYYPERRLTDFGHRHEIPVLNLAPVMAKQAEDRQVFFHAFRDSLGVGHWNVEGHRVAGELIASWLAQEFPKPR